MTIPLKKNQHQASTFTCVGAQLLFFKSSEQVPAIAIQG